MAKKLDILENAGIQVLVLSGNHDINSRNAAKFIGKVMSEWKVLRKRNSKPYTSPSGLMMHTQRIQYPSSYIWEFSWCRFLMLDVNGVEKVNHVSEQTMVWLEQELKKAKEDGVPVVN